MGPAKKGTQGQPAFQSPNSRGRPRNRWRIRVVCIHAMKHPEFLRDRDHPFASISDEDRIEEIDSYCARLWARALKSRRRPGGLSAAA